MRSPLAVTEFGPSYRRAAVMQGALAVIGSAIVLSFVVPFTIMVIMPIASCLRRQP